MIKNKIINKNIDIYKKIKNIVYLLIIFLNK